MPAGSLNRTIGKVADRVPGVRRLPVVALLSAAEVAMLTRDHVRRLTPAQRRRLAALVRAGRGGTGRLTESEAAELQRLVEILEPRQLFGEAARRLSPVPLPRRLTHGRRG